MAFDSATNPTLLDIANASDPSGRISAVAEILNETNEINLDAVWVEGNLPTGHRTVLRTGIPQPTWRRFNEGIQPSKSTTAQVTFNTGMLEALSEVDCALADLNGNTSQFRVLESRAHLEGMSQELADAVIFGNEATQPEGITGLAAYYNDLSAESADNIIDAGGTGSDNRSIWLVGWSESKTACIYPKGSKAGLQMTDMGKVVVENADGNNGRMLAYRTHFRQDAGLKVPDWRFNVRICNIDVSLLTNVYTAGAFTAGANLPDLLFQAMRLVPNLGMVRPAFYMSRDIATWVARQTVAIGQNGLISTARVSGDQRFTERFHGIPMRRVDVLAADEARVV